MGSKLVEMDFEDFPSKFSDTLAIINVSKRNLGTVYRSWLDP